MHTVMLHQYLAVLPSLNNILDKFSIPQTGSSLGSNCTCVALCAAWGSQEEVTANATLLKCCYLPLDEYTHARVRAHQGEAIMLRHTQAQPGTHARTISYTFLLVYRRRFKKTTRG